MRQTGTVGSTAGLSAREESARVLRAALEEVRWARARFAKRGHVTGYRGEDYEQRWQRVETSVLHYFTGAVAAARTRALRAGWTEAELASAGLAG